ncbi:DUF4817 domain-containing protein [Trichonephila clavipes]|nr:DUF4817 domain-containing protein [Trichonephila clavipes]
MVLFHGFIYHRTLFFFETQCPVNGWITETVNAQRYQTLLRETVVPCLIQRGQISNVTFMQDGATSHTGNPVKAFLIQTFGEDRIVSRHCRYPWPPRSPDLTLSDFWLWGYLKSRVYLSGPSSLLELKDAIRREVSSIHPDMLHSAVAGFVTHLECLLPCASNQRAISWLSAKPKNSKTFHPDEEPYPRLPDSIARPIAIMPLSRMENTTFAMPNIIDSHDMGLRTVYSPDAQKKTPIQRLFLVL